MESDASVKEALAVFDVDGTLFRRGLLPALTRRLVNEEVFPERVLHMYTRDLAQRLKQAGYYLIAISGSPHGYTRNLSQPFRL
jgi:phosphoserine phosphatase